MLLRSGRQVLRPVTLPRASPGYGNYRVRAAARWRIRRFIERSVRRSRRKRAMRNAVGTAFAGGTLAVPALRARRQIGNRVRSSNCKRFQILQVGFGAYSKATLNQTNLTALGALSATQMNRRSRNLVNLRGFFIQAEMRNKVETPLYVNIAIISPKDGDSIIDADFFRPNNSDKRGLSFTDARINGSLFMHETPINPDKYTILMHHRFMLAGENDSGPPTATLTLSYASSGYSWKRYTKYVKVNRQIRFTENTSLTPESGNCFLVYWANPMGLDNLVPEVPADTIDIGWRVITYFRDTNN